MKDPVITPEKAEEIAERLARGEISPEHIPLIRQAMLALPAMALASWKLEQIVQTYEQSEGRIRSITAEALTLASGRIASVPIPPERIDALRNSRAEFARDAETSGDLVKVLTSAVMIAGTFLV